MLSLEPVCLYMLLYITIYILLYVMFIVLYAIICYRILNMLLYIMDCYGRTIPDLQIDVKHTPWIQLAELCPSTVEQRISPHVEASRLSCHSAGRSGSGGLVPK